jgi:hypothetical protein
MGRRAIRQSSASRKFSGAVGDARVGVFGKLWKRWGEKQRAVVGAAAGYMNLGQLETKRGSGEQQQGRI